MSVLQQIKATLGLGDDEEDADGLAVLKDVLAQRAARLSLTAEYGRPTISQMGEPTAVFPITLFHDGERYGSHGKEFPIPDNGLQDTAAPLTQFLNKHGISTLDELGAIEGTEASAVLKDNGEIEVQQTGVDNE